MKRSTRTRAWSGATKLLRTSELDAACRRLLKAPQIGRAISEVYRRWRHERHLVYYRALGSGDLLIVRIVHERQLPPKHL